MTNRKFNQLKRKVCNVLTRFHEEDPISDYYGVTPPFPWRDFQSSVLRCFSSRRQALAFAKDCNRRVVRMRPEEKVDAPIEFYVGAEVEQAIHDSR